MLLSSFLTVTDWNSDCIPGERVYFCHILACCHFIKVLSTLSLCSSRCCAAVATVYQQKNFLHEQVCPPVVQVSTHLNLHLIKKKDRSKWLVWQSLPRLQPSTPCVSLFLLQYRFYFKGVEGRCCVTTLVKVKWSASSVRLEMISHLFVEVWICGSAAAVCIHYRDGNLGQFLDCSVEQCRDESKKWRTVYSVFLH